MKNMRSSLMLLAVALLAICLPASATVNYYWYNLSSPVGNVPSPHSYGANPYLLPVSGFQTNDLPDISGGTWNIGSYASTGLYGKVTNGNPGETGLGVQGDPTGDHEEWFNPTGTYKEGFVMFDVSNLQANPNLLYFYLQIGSSQTHEGYDIWGSNPGSQFSGTLLAKGEANEPSAITPFFQVPNWRSYQYIWVGSYRTDGANDQANILVDSKIAFSSNPNPPIPEPGTLLMLGSGLVSLSYAGRKRWTNR